MAPTPKSQGRKAVALEDPSVKGWYEAHASGAQLTADVMIRGLSRLLQELQLSPVGATDLARSKPQKLEALLVRYVMAERKRGAADSYIRKTFAALKSYLRHEGVAFALYPKLRVIEGITIRDEAVPTPELLGRILAGLPLRWQCAAVLMAHAGLRPGVLALHSGVAATGNRTAPVLQLAHLPELSLHGEPSFARLPFAIRVPEELSKTGNAYVTFGTPEAAKILTRYLRERQEQGESLLPGSPVIAGKRDGEILRTVGTPVTTETVTFAIRTAMRHVAPEQRIRPYALRAYCSTMMLLAEQRTGGKITRDAREAMLSHDLGVGGRYHLSKKLTPEIVESLREQYSAAVPFLETGGQREGERAEFRRMVLLVAGYSQEEAARLSQGSNDEIIALAQAKAAKAREAAAEPPKTQRIVSVSEAQPLLDRGWRTVTAVGAALVLEPPR